MDPNAWIEVVAITVALVGGFVGGAWMGWMLGYWRGRAQEAIEWHNRFSAHRDECEERLREALAAK